MGRWHGMVLPTELGWMLGRMLGRITRLCKRRATRCVLLSSDCRASGSPVQSPLPRGASRTHAKEGKGGGVCVPRALGPSVPRAFWLGDGCGAAGCPGAGGHRVSRRGRRRGRAYTHPHAPGTHARFGRAQQSDAGTLARGNARAVGKAVGKAGPSARLPSPRPSLAHPASGSEAPGSVDVSTLHVVRAYVAAWRGAHALRRQAPLGGACRLVLVLLLQSPLNIRPAASKTAFHASRPQGPRPIRSPGFLAR